ncbi:MAG: signal peptidase I [Lachnospiraceae bacterium]|nr:signal peptidase I [Lachnospiraceae bacterium]
MSKKKKELKMPAVEELEKELHREKYRKNFGRTLRSTIYTLITVAAVSILVATLFLPVLQIYGSSMTPTLTDGNIVVSLKASEFEQGDIIAFYYNNKILVKRVIATEGEWVSMDEKGYVYVDGKLLDEPYVSEYAFGECDIEFPYQVPEGKLFVMGDHRSVSVDSRSSAVGCVSSEQIVGKLAFRIWPISEIGKIE